MRGPGAAGHSEGSQHPPAGMHAPLQVLKPLAQMMGPPQAPPLHVAVPLATWQSAFVQQLPAGMQALPQALCVVHSVGQPGVPWQAP
jgi:hypothetical protein